MAMIFSRRKIRFNPLDFGFIYLIRSSNKGFPVYKIGKAKNVDTREKNIDQSIKGTRERVVFTVHVVFVYFFEKKVLHRLFEYKRFNFKGSGKTEYFKLNPIEVLFAKFIMLCLFTISLIFLGIVLSALFLLGTWYGQSSEITLVEQVKTWLLKLVNVTR